MMRVSSERRVRDEDRGSQSAVGRFSGRTRLFRFFQMLVLCRTHCPLRLASVIVVGPGTDIETLLLRLADAMQGIPRILKTPVPTASLVRFTPKGLELEAGFWIADPKNGSGDVCFAVNFELWRLYRQRGVRLPGQAADELPVKDETDKSLIHKTLSLSEDESQA